MPKNDNVVRLDPARGEANSLAAINKMIGVIARSANKLNEQIHNCGLMCMEHTKEYGDALPGARLVDAMPMSHRRSLLIQWFAEYSPITIAKDGKTQKMKGHLRGSKEEREELWNIQGAKATPFYALQGVEREPDVPTYESVHDNVVAFIKRIEKKAEAIEDVEGKAKALDEIAKFKAAVG